MLSQSCLQPSWSPYQLPHSWGHRGSTAVPSPSAKPPTAAVPLAGAMEEEAAGLVYGESGAKGCVHTNSENKPEEGTEDVLTA